MTPSEILRFPKCSRHPYQANPRHFQVPTNASGRNQSPLRVNFALECSCGLDAADKERERDIGRRKRRKKTLSGTLRPLAS